MEQSRKKFLKHFLIGATSATLISEACKKDIGSTSSSFVSGSCAFQKFSLRKRQ